jgi:hypothetical protein
MFWINKFILPKQRLLIKGPSTGSRMLCMWSWPLMGERILPVCPAARILSLVSRAAMTSMECRASFVATLETKLPLIWGAPQMDAQMRRKVSLDWSPAADSRTPDQKLPSLPRSKLGSPKDFSVENLEPGDGGGCSNFSGHLVDAFHRRTLLSDWLSICKKSRCSLLPTKFALVSMFVTRSSASTET